MNVAAINQGIKIAGNAVASLVTITDSLPSGSDKDQAQQLLKEAGERLKEAEARVGHELGFPICKQCWPPEIMLQNDLGEYVCTHCNRKVPPGAAAEISGKDDLSTW
jgi:hypothetical protein